MKISRVDPYAVRWSADGTIALALESTGILLLDPDCEELLKGNVKWHRARPVQSLEGRVIDMQWSPTLQSRTAGCQLACVLDTGSVILLELVNDEVIETGRFDGVYSAVCWAGTQLVLGDDSGNVHIYENQQILRTLQTKTRVVSLAAGPSLIGVASADNSCTVFDEQFSGVEVVAPSRKRVVSLAFQDTTLIVQRCGSVEFCSTTKCLESIPLNSSLPGSLIALQGQWALVHENGIRSGSESLGIPEIEGDLIGLEKHPYFPIAAAVVARSAASSDDWEFPILSRQSVNLALFPLDAEAVPPRRVRAAAPATWLAAMMQKAQINEVTASSGSANNVTTTPTNLGESLRSLFLSEWFDTKRLQWYYCSAEDRQKVVTEMRQSIASILKHAEPSTKIDRLIRSFYLNEAHEEFHMDGDFIDDAFVSNTTALANSTMKSVTGTDWKRCAITLLPLMTTDTKSSADGLYTVYKSIPPIRDNEGSSHIGEELLAAANFCILSGSSWSA